MLRKFGLAAKLSALAAVGFLGLYSCSSGPTAPDTAGRGYHQWMQDETPAQLQGIDIDAAYDQPLISAAKPSGWVSDAMIDFAESNDEIEGSLQIRRWLLVAQTVGPEGGTIYFGNDDVGMSEIIIPAGALDEATTISLVHKVRGKRDLFLFPEGTTFNVPITVRFSLASLNQRQINKLLNMRMYYHNDQGGGWEQVPSYSDGEWVIATLEHFSRYAIGSDDAR